jgi:methyl-accepting chemotaxis protein
VISEIGTASDKQNQGVIELNTAVVTVNLVTQKTAANAEESVSAAEELSSQSLEMQSAVQSFELSATKMVAANAGANAGRGSTYSKAAKQQSTASALVNGRYHQQQLDQMLT